MTAALSHQSSSLTLKNLSMKKNYKSFPIAFIISAEGTESAIYLKYLSIYTK